MSSSRRAGASRRSSAAITTEVSKTRTVAPPSIAPSVAKAPQRGGRDALFERRERTREQLPSGLGVLPLRGGEHLAAQPGGPIQLRRRGGAIDPLEIVAGQAKRHPLRLEPGLLHDGADCSTNDD